MSLLHAAVLKEGLFFGGGLQGMLAGTRRCLGAKPTITVCYMKPRVSAVSVQCPLIQVVSSLVTAFSRL